MTNTVNTHGTSGRSVTIQLPENKMAGEVIAEAVSMLMDAGVHPVEIRKHLQPETAWIDREMAQVDAPTWSA